MAKTKTKITDVIDRIKVRITFTEPLLGTTPADPKLFKTYQEAKHPDGESEEERLAALSLEEAVEKKMTVFPRNDKGEPILWDYQVKGFFKGTQGGLNRLKEEDKKTQYYLKAYKKEIDLLVFVFPRQIEINMNGREIEHKHGKERRPVNRRSLDDCQRPLRSPSREGDIVTLVCSEMIPAGASIDIEIGYMDERFLDCIHDWLDYGILSGMGQWRNSGMGRFTWEEIGKGEVSASCEKPSE